MTPYYKLKSLADAENYLLALENIVFLVSS